MTKRLEAVDTLTPVVTVPDVKGIKNPLAVKVKNDDGDMVRPLVVLALVNAEMKKREHARLAELAKRKPQPIPAKVKRLDDRTTAERMADTLLSVPGRFPINVYAPLLDAADVEVLRRDLERGAPLHRETVVRGVGQLWDRAKREMKIRS